MTLTKMLISIFKTGKKKNLGLLRHFFTYLVSLLVVEIQPCDSSLQIKRRALFFSTVRAEWNVRINILQSELPYSLENSKNGKYRLI